MNRSIKNITYHNKFSRRISLIHKNKQNLDSIHTLDIHSKTRIEHMIAAPDTSISFLPKKHNIKPSHLKDILLCLILHYPYMLYNFLYLYDLTGYLITHFVGVLYRFYHSPWALLLQMTVSRNQTHAYWGYPSVHAPFLPNCSN